MIEYQNVILADLLQDKGYIRGPFGSALKRPEMQTEGIPVYEQQHTIYNSREFRFFISEEKFEELKRFQVEANDLVISCSGTVGRVTIIKEEDPKGIISQALLILRVDSKKVLPQYLKYFFTSKEGYNAIVSRSSGSVQVNISKRNVIEQIPLRLPSTNIQKKIVGVLSSIDKKIEKNEQINNNLPTHPCNARIAAKQRRQTPKTDECLHTDSKVSDRGGNKETAEQSSSLLAS